MTLALAIVGFLSLCIAMSWSITLKVLDPGKIDSETRRAILKLRRKELACLHSGHPATARAAAESAEMLERRLTSDEAIEALHE